MNDGEFVWGGGGVTLVMELLEKLHVKAYFDHTKVLLKRFKKHHLY